MHKNQIFIKARKTIWQFMVKLSSSKLNEVNQSFVMQARTTNSQFMEEVSSSKLNEIHREIDPGLYHI